MGGSKQYPVHHRRSIRLPDWDYDQGVYFITLVTKNRVNLFGEIIDGQMHLNAIGKCTTAILIFLHNHFFVRLDAWVIMPNHLHCILEVQHTGKASARKAVPERQRSLTDALPQRPIGTDPGSLGAIVQNLKSISTRRINSMRLTPSGQVWQRNYYEHIIRDGEDWQKIADYIEINPIKWEEDQENILRFYR